MKYVLVARKTILKLTKELPIKQKRVLMLHYGLENGNSLTFEAIGSLLHCTKQNVQKLEVNALKNLLIKVQELDYDIYDINMLRKSFIYYDRRKLFLCSIIGCTYDELMHLKKTLNDQTRYYPILFKVHGFSLDEEQDLDILTYPERQLYFEGLRVLKANYEKIYVKNEMPASFYENHTLCEILDCSFEQLKVLLKYIRPDTNVYAIMEKSFGSNFKERFHRQQLNRSEYSVFRECIMRLKTNNENLFINKRLRKHISYHHKNIWEIIGCSKEEISDLVTYLDDNDYALLQEAFGKEFDEVYHFDEINKRKRNKLRKIMCYLFNKYFDQENCEEIKNNNIENSFFLNILLLFIPSNYAKVIREYIACQDYSALSAKYDVQKENIEEIINNFITWMNQIKTSYNLIFGCLLLDITYDASISKLKNTDFHSLETLLFWFLPKDVQDIVYSYMNNREILWDKESLDKLTNALTWFWTSREAFATIYQNEIPNRNWTEINAKLVRMKRSNKNLDIA